MTGSPRLSGLTKWMPWIWPATAALALTSVLASPDAYLHATVARMLPLALLAASVAIVTGHAGLPTLGQVAPYAVGAYTTTQLASSGVDLAPAHLAAAAFGGAGAGALLGVVLVRHRGTVFLMISLAVAELTAITAGQWRTVTGGTDGLAGLPPARLPGLAPLTDDRAILLYAATIVTVVTVICVMVLRGRTRLLLGAARGNESRARASGHPVNAYLLAVHTGAGAVAGIAGALLVATHHYITPTDVGFTVAALALLAVVIGGAASLPGAIAGALIILAVRDVLAAPLPGHAPLLLGVLFAAAVYLLPGGLAAMPARLAALFTNHASRQTRSRA